MQLVSHIKRNTLYASILQENSIPKTPQQNGVAERCNRTLLERARCLFIHSGHPKMIWAAAFPHAAGITNLVERRRKWRCPAESWEVKILSYQLVL